jgi:hypothetical protein
MIVISMWRKNMKGKGLELNCIVAATETSSGIKATEEL